jgi:hypothetical protein
MTKSILFVILAAVLAPTNGAANAYVQSGAIINSGYNTVCWAPPAPGATDAQCGPMGLDPYPGAGFAWASSSFEALRAQAWSSSDGISSVEAIGSASFHDVLYPTCPGCQFEGWMVITGMIEGGIEEAGGLARGTFDITARTQSSYYGGLCNVVMDNQHTASICRGQVAVHAGETVTIDVSLGARAFSYSGYAGANFQHTGFITGINFLDFAGNPVSNVGYISDSGTVYGAATAAPEPGSALLIGCGAILCAIGGLGRRRNPSAPR